MASRAARILTSLATVSATALLLSCGGSHDSLTGPSLVAPDGLHPSAQQYVLWMSRIFPAVRQMLEGAA